MSAESPKFDLQNVDYSTYLVTDSTMIPESSTFLKQVEDSIKGGATIVQLREKSLSTLEFIARAEKVHQMTKRAGIPLLINDRIDVALAIDCEGVHIGQDDMPAKLARKILGEDKIIGITCSNPGEVEVVCQEQIADYVGLGTVYQTNTKKDTKTPHGIGPIGIRQMLRVLNIHNSSEAGTGKQIKSVAIGGVNHTNASKVLFQCKYKNETLDGLAIVSCIMAAQDAKSATETFIERANSKFVHNDLDSASISPKSITEKHPLVHHITNNVVKNFSANVTLAIGGSPIMSELAEEFQEFSEKFENLSLVLNLGTPIPSQVELFKHAIVTYNETKTPIVFDPVAAGASEARLNVCKQLLNAGHMTVIKGNLGEISAIYKLTTEYGTKIDKVTEVAMRGVDSAGELREHDIFKIAQAIIEDFACIVVITGEINYVCRVDGHGSLEVEKVQGGSPVMGLITGTGCSLGSTIAAYLGASSSNQFSATVAAVRIYNEAGRTAAISSSKNLEEVPKPAAFQSHFIDTLYTLSTR
ncbi:putative probable thiamine biosynthetic bifunctional enzyme [[Candida] railenensis]|uniref:Probable thiamine biosynthetic bifunctional enzyme n=1 Tax=[Candida] railenensis TaxID=45579 RepID=A0A9P0QUT8_9ASCO|nr:putative probable thiamine biosynthetic bifunctional enzyme [[Candida] railenensis]